MAIRGKHSLRARTYTGTTAEWSASTTVYRAGSLLINSQTGAVKIADGSNNYASLAYVAPASGTSAPSALSVINKTGSPIAADKLVAVTGLDATSGLPKIVLADADVAGHDDIYVTTAAIADSAEGVVNKFALSAANLNTNSASAAGDPVFLSTTAGGFVHTAPSGNDDQVEPVGFVVVKSATVGQIQWLISPRRIVAANEIQAGSLTNTHVSASAGIERTKLAVDAGKISMSIPIDRLRLPAGGPLTASEAAGGFNFSFSSHVMLAQAEITDNETETSVALAQITLPPEYQDGGAITVRLPVSIVKTGSAVDNGSTIDLSVYKQAAGAVGSDLVSTAAQAFAAVDTWYNKDFVVDPTGLVAGDVLNIEITSSVIDSEAGAGTLRLNMQPVLVLLDVQG